MLLAAPIPLLDGVIAFGAVLLAAGCLTPLPPQGSASVATSPSNPPPHGYAASVLTAVVRDHAAEVQGCFNRALERNSTVHGRLVLQWTIGADGRGAEMQVREGPSNDQGLSACITQAIVGWQFPPAPSGAAHVSYTFNFE